jgi:hypothetical protein
MLTLPFSHAPREPEKETCYAIKRAIKLNEKHAMFGFVNTGCSPERNRILYPISKWADAIGRVQFLAKAISSKRTVIEPSV